MFFFALINEVLITNIASLHNYAMKYHWHIITQFTLLSFKSSKILNIYKMINTKFNFYRRDQMKE